MANTTSNVSPHIGNVDINDFLPKDIITRDVCIIGGGASGTYGAIRLRDLSKTVVVVEEKAVLGGNTATYTDPASGKTAEMGVVAWYTNSTVTNFFNRLGVSLKVTDVQRAGFAALTNIPVDFSTGKRVENVFTGNLNEGWPNYVRELAKYPYLEDGFDIPYPVPSDFLLPFGQFIKKYNIGGAMTVLSIFGNGMGDILEQPTLYAFKLISMETVEALQENTFRTSLNGRNQEIYEKAQAELEGDVLYNTKVLAMDRDGNQPHVVVQTPSGLKLIKAKKLLLTIPPKLDNLVGFDLDDNERSLFGQFKNTAWYTGILKNTGIPENTILKNFGADTPYNLPVLPGPYFIQASNIPGHFNVKYCSPYSVSESFARQDIIAGIQKLKFAGTLDTTTPEFVELHAHMPFELTVSPQAIEDGFYKKLYALQGLKNTYWSGATFHAQDSSKLWVFTDKIISEFIKEL